MNKRLVIKTALICWGIFLVIIGGILYFMNNPENQIKRETTTVLVANMNIKAGQKLTSDLYRKIKIPVDFVTPKMVKASELSVSKVYGNNVWCTSEIYRGEYIMKDDLDTIGAKVKKDLRITIIPLDMEGRLANLIKKGSVVDLRVQEAGSNNSTKLVLQGLEILDMLDEAGNSTVLSAPSRKAYIKVMLDRNKLDALYKAQNAGKIIMELYVSPLQQIH